MTKQCGKIQTSHIDFRVINIIYNFRVCCWGTLSEGQNHTESFGDLLIKAIASSLKCIMRQPFLELAVSCHMFEKGSVMRNKDPLQISLD